MLAVQQERESRGLFRLEVVFEPVFRGLKISHVRDRPSKIVKYVLALKPGPAKEALLR